MMGIMPQFKGWLTSLLRLFMVCGMLPSQMKYKHWMQTFSKSLLVMFVLQVLLSASCVTTASAQRIMQDKHVQLVHCHMKDMPSHNMGGDMSHMPSCEHCDAPDVALMTPSHAVPDLGLALVVAVLVMPQVLADDVAPSVVRTHIFEPPSRGSSLLYTTSRRILI